MKDNIDFKHYVKKIPLYLLIIMAFVSVAGVFYYTIFLSKTFVNSDIFDTLIWAKATFESKRIIAPDFNYSAILPFGGSLLMLPFIKFFGASFTTHIIGMVLFELIFFASLWLFTKTANFDLTWTMITFIAFCSLWLCADKFREMFMEHIIYYSLIVLFILIGYSLVFKFNRALSDNSKKKILVYGIISFVFFMLTATDGYQIIAMTALPLVASLVLEKFFDIKTKLFSKENKNAVITVVIIGVATVIGLVLLKILLNGTTAEYAEEYSLYDTNKNIYNYGAKAKSFIDNWYKIFEVFFISNISLTSFEQLPIMIKWLFASVLLIVIPVNAVFYRFMKNEHTRKFFWIALTVQVLTLMLWFFGRLYDVSWRLIPLITVSLILFLLDLQYLSSINNLKRFSSVFVILLLLFSVYNYNYLIAYQPAQNKYGPVEDIVDIIDRNNISNGYGSYWVSETINVLSNDQLQIDSILCDKAGIKYYEYQNFNKDLSKIEKNKPTCLILETNLAKEFKKTDSFKSSEKYLIDKYEAESDFDYNIYCYSCDIYDLIGY